MNYFWIGPRKARTAEKYSPREEAWRALRPKGGGPKGGARRSGGPKGGAPQRGGSKGGGTKSGGLKFRDFPLSRSHFRSFSISLGVFSWNFGGVWSARTLNGARLEFSGCRVKPRRKKKKGEGREGREGKREGVWVWGGSQPPSPPSPKPQTSLGVGGGGGEEFGEEGYPSPKLVTSLGFGFPLSPAGVRFFCFCHFFFFFFVFFLGFEFFFGRKSFFPPPQTQTHRRHPPSGSASLFKVKHYGGHATESHLFVEPHMMSAPAFLLLQVFQLPFQDFAFPTIVPIRAQLTFLFCFTRIFAVCPHCPHWDSTPSPCSVVSGSVHHADKGFSAQCWFDPDPLVWPALHWQTRGCANVDLEHQLLLDRLGENLANPFQVLVSGHTPDFHCFRIIHLLHRWVSQLDCAMSSRSPLSTLPCSRKSLPYKWATFVSVG